MSFQTESKNIDLNDIRKQVRSTSDEIMSFSNANKDAMGGMDSTNYNVAKGNTSNWDLLWGGLKNFPNSFQDTTGINGAKVPDMQSAVTDYVTKLQNHLKEVKSETSSKKAFAGAYADSVEKYVQAICDACEAIISNLLMFNDKLNEIREAYAARAEEMASDVSADTTKMGQTFTGYKG